mgnify:CR=1 FL=1
MYSKNNPYLYKNAPVTDNDVLFGGAIADILAKISA